jgi:hypothetical protein
VIERDGSLGIEFRESLADEVGAFLFEHAHP